MKKLELSRIKEVGRKTMADFVHSESGSVGVKNAAVIGAFAAALALSQSVGEANGPSTTVTPDGSIIIAI